MPKLDISYELLMEPEQDQVRGNASAIDPETDRENEDRILERLQNGNDWAWCSVTVKAQVIVNGILYTGTDSLGQCSYENEEDFKEGGYWEDMQYGALQDLARQIPGARFEWPDLFVDLPQEQDREKVRREALDLARTIRRAHDNEEEIHEDDACHLADLVIALEAAQ